MKLHTRYLLAGLLAVFIAGTCLAVDTLKDYGDIKGRSYHEEMYSEKRCNSCHTSNEPSGFPPDDCCLECHDIDALVAETARKGDDIRQNPHNNLHYGKDVPCMECHGEHSQRQPLCNDCHNFGYKDHKP